MTLEVNSYISAQNGNNNFERNQFKISQKVKKSKIGQEIRHWRYDSHNHRNLPRRLYSSKTILQRQHAGSIVHTKDYFICPKIRPIYCHSMPHMEVFQRKNRRKIVLDSEIRQKTFQHIKLHGERRGLRVAERGQERRPERPPARALHPLDGLERLDLYSDYLKLRQYASQYCFMVSYRETDPEYFQGQT